MADVVIRGMKMPTDGRITIQIGVDGAIYSVEKCKITAEKYEKDLCAVPLPEGHGRLIDADAFKAMCLSATKEARPDFIRHEDWLKSCAVTMAFCRDIEERPTIVPADGGGK